MDHANAVVHGPFVPVQAMNAMEPWKLRDDPMFLKLIRKLPEKTANVAPRNNEYVGRLKAYYMGKMLP